MPTVIPHCIHTFCFQFTGLDFDVHMSIFVSPIVFPLAFSINGELQEIFFIILFNVFVRSYSTSQAFWYYAMVQVCTIDLKLHLIGQLKWYSCYETC